MFPDKDSVGFTVDINLNETQDAALARIFLVELPTTARNVLNVPAIVYHDIKLERGEQQVKCFPEVKNKARASNGEVSFKLEAKHLKNGIDKPLSQLVGFRMFLHFHLHAIKINLHSKMRKRVNNMELIIKQARRDEEEPKVYKEKHGGNKG